MYVHVNQLTTILFTLHKIFYHIDARISCILKHNFQTLVWHIPTYLFVEWVIGIRGRIFATPNYIVDTL